MNSEACPSPKIGGKDKFFLFLNWTNAFIIFFSSTSVRIAVPHSTSSTHSVSGRRMIHGFLKKKDSFCTPPESVQTSIQFFSNTIISRKEAGGIKTKFGLERIAS